METVERGARVWVSNVRNEYHFGKIGTVRALDGDPGFQATPEEVNIAFDDGTPTCWILIADLTRL